MTKTKTRFLHYFGLGVLEMCLLVACLRDAPEPTPHSETLVGCGDLQSGDLLLFALPLDYTLKNSSQSKDTTVTPIHAGDEVIYFHIAIVEREGDSLFTIDATTKRNVDRHPLDTTLASFVIKNGGLPRIEVFRLKELSDTGLYLSQAKQLLGRRYDTRLDSQSDEIYCSELIHYSYVTRNGDTLFPLLPMDWTTSDGTLPPYWTEMFRRIEMDPPNGLPGITPRDIAQNPHVQPLGVLQTQPIKKSEKRP